jgi:ABC-type branched-subunit amino acid transport system ATPase component/ABC-type branched-subunit amino acid transport system permease subunit
VTEFVQFVVLGLGLGAIYTLLSQGVVMIFRGSGVVNFAQGAFALAGAAAFVQIRSAGGALWLALAAATAAGAALGLVTQGVVLHRLRNSAPITKVMATLGILVILQSAGLLKYQSQLEVVPQFLPQNTLEVAGVTMPADRLILFGLAVGITAALWYLQSRTRVGLATRAAAENELAASTLAWSPSALALGNWACGGALAGLSGALIVPITGLIVPNLSLLIVPALAAALLGGLSSPWITLAGAMGIGIAQSLLTRYVTLTGAGDAFPFLVIIVLLVVTGQSLPLRHHLTERLPRIGSGRVRAPAVVAWIAVTSILIEAVFSNNWLAAVTASFSASIVLLSIVVLTGYAGQISLAQYTMAGLGAWIAGRLVATQGVPFSVALVLGVVIAVPIGLLFALPALRTRGVNLAVVTLGLAVAVDSLIFQNVDYTGGITGTMVGSPRFLGMAIDSDSHPQRYALFTLILLVAVCLLVANIRSGRVGRRLIAIRENERAAASLGISVVRAKLLAFGVAAGIAALGGILIGFDSTSIIYTSFEPFQSIYALTYVVIGGIGFVGGALVGSTLSPGGLATITDGLFSGIENYLALIGGVIVVISLMLNPNGVMAALTDLRARVVARFGGRPRARWLSWRMRVPWSARSQREAVERDLSTPGVARKQDPKALQIRGLTVRYGGVTAVDDVSFDVCPGEIVGLIGPNGAGKTSVIDAVTGFAPLRGEVTLGNVALGRRSATRRSQLGIARSWQSLELFEDVTVRENLQIASEGATASAWSILRSLLWPQRVPLTAAARSAIHQFDLSDDLERRPGDLPYGRRRLLGIARAVALDPTVLLLDEPASGLTRQESDELARLLRELAKSRDIGILLVEHDVEMVMSLCDRVIVLNFGQKIAEGAPGPVRHDPEVIAAYLGQTHEAEEQHALD